MLQVTDGDPGITETAVFRRWVRRETRKDAYPDADPDGWDGRRLQRELEETYDEPAAPASRGSPEWTSLTVPGRELGSFDAFPACGWDALSNDGTIGDAVDRLQGEDLAEEFPDATRTVEWFRDQYPEGAFGALVVRQYDEAWPPVVLEGNHRACGAHWASREGASVSLEVHLGHERPLPELPVADPR